MAVIGVPAILAPGIPVDLSRSLPARDPVLAGIANNGMRFMFDLAFPFSYPGGPQLNRPDAAAPIDTQVIYDVAERANGSYILPAGSITYAGGGFDFTNSQASAASVDTRNNGIKMPASVLADLWTAFSGVSQQYLFTMWAKLPSAANWNTNASLQSMAGDLAYTSNPSLFTLAQFSTGALQVRRQTAAGTYDVTNALTLTPAAGDYGSVCQIAHWRNASGQFLRLRSANGTLITSRAIGPDNTQNFSANQFVVGRNGASFAGASATSTLAAFSGVRIYRAWMENLARSGRDPATVLDAEYLAVTARNVFS